MSAEPTTRPNTKSKPNLVTLEEAARRYLECYGALALDGSQAARSRWLEALMEYDQLLAGGAAVH